MPAPRLQIRADPELLSRLDSALEMFRTENPDLDLCRSDLVRLLIDRGLATRAWSAVQPSANSVQPIPPALCGEADLHDAVVRICTRRRLSPEDFTRMLGQPAHLAFPYYFAGEIAEGAPAAFLDAIHQFVQADPQGSAAFKGHWT